MFYDLGFDEAEARVLEMRADLMAALRDHIPKERLDSERGGKEARNHSTAHLRTHERRLAGFQRGYAARAGDAPRTQTDAEIGRLTETVARD